MAWTDPTNWPVGTLVDAAFLNTHIRDNLNHLYDAPACQLTHSTTQSAGSGGEIHVDFDTEVNDPDGMHPPSGAGSDDEITLSRTGMWWLSSTVEISTSLADSTDVWLRVDFVWRAYLMLGGSGPVALSVGGMEYLESGYDVTCQLNHHAGGPATLAAGPQYGVQWLHA